MTNWIEWFRYQLKASEDAFVWAAEQIPPPLLNQIPPNADYFGLWEPARHVWHVSGYEQYVVMPSMNQWLHNSGVPVISWADTDAAWAGVTDRSLRTLTQKFRHIRQMQIEMLDELMDSDWDTPRPTVWEERPLSMVVTKTLQHTYEHGDTLMRMGLWWDA